MNWEALGAIAELIGGLAVLVTLVYLALQVRQNNQMQRQQISAHQTNHYVANTHVLANNGELMDIFRKASTGEEMSPLERWRFGTFMFGILENFQEMYFLNKAGVQYEFRVVGMQKSVYRYLSTPGGKVWWDSVRGKQFVNEFAEYIDLLLKDGPPELT